MAEAGYPNFEAVAWFGLLAPTGTPPVIVERLSKEVNAILKSPEMNARLAGMGAIVQGTSPDEFRRFMTAEVKKWAPVAAQAQIRVE